MPISILIKLPNHLKKLEVKRLFLQNLSLPAADFYKQGHCELPSVLKKNELHICKMKTYYITKSWFRFKLWNIKNTLMTCFHPLVMVSSARRQIQVKNTSFMSFFSPLTFQLFCLSEERNSSTVTFSCSPKSSLTQLLGSLTQVKLQPNTFPSGRAIWIPALLMITFSPYYIIWVSLEGWMPAQSSEQHLVSNTLLWPPSPTPQSILLLIKWFFFPHTQWHLWEFYPFLIVFPGQVLGWRERNGFCH